METRPCRKCEIDKEEENFRYTKTVAHGVRTRICNECWNEQRTERRHATANSTFSQRDAMEDANYEVCRCGNVTHWIDAVEQASGSVWYQCWYCGYVIPSPTMWRVRFPLFKVA